MENIKEVKEAAASLMKDRSKREAFAEMLVEYVQPNHITLDVIGMLLNTRQLNPGDLLVKKVRKGLKVWTHVPGAIPLKGEITVSERANYVLDMAVIGAHANEWELESGEIGTVESIRNEMMLKLRDYYLNKAFTALSTIWTATNTPSNFTSVGGTITQTALVNAIDAINQTTPGAKVIVGSRAALQPVTSFTYWHSNATTGTEMVQSMAEEVLRTGKLGSFYGVPLMVIDQVYDNPEDHNKLIPEDKILVIGQNVGDFVLYGPSRTKEYTDPRPTPPTWNCDISPQFGFIIDNAEGIYVLGDIS
jgi:hypothetical protein